MTVDTNLPGERHGPGSGAEADVARQPYPPGQQHHPSEFVTVPGAHRAGVAVEPANAPASAAQRPTGAPAAAQRPTGAPAAAQRPTEPANRPGRDLQAEVDRLAEAVGDRFRLPVADDPEPSARYLIGVSVWAALLGLGGIAVALRALVGMLATDTSWYTPTVVAIGTAGLVCTIGAFASVHRRRMPWLMLGVATVALLAGWYLSGAA